jgi:hypothetical protein
VDCLLLLDLNLPNQKAWELHEQLSTQGPIIPVIIVTGLPLHQSTALLAGAGALFPTLTRYDEGHWQEYEQGNRVFAEGADTRLRPDDMVWVQDYQLMLQPRKIRQASPEMPTTPTYPKNRTSTVGISRVIRGKPPVE